MICRNCGTEIADKAIVCYRCGAGTTDPVRRPAAVRSRAAAGCFPLAALVLLVLLGLFLGQAGQTDAAARRGAGLGAAFAIVIAIVLLVVRIVRRR